jgi:hypothetical protein
LCGSILPQEFPWNDILDRGQVTAVLNEFGSEDIWSKFVRWFVGGTGASGQEGFWSRHSCIFQKKFSFKHSEYFERGHIEQSWVPFIAQNLAARPRTTFDVHAPRPNAPWGLYIVCIAVVAALVYLFVPWAHLMSGAETSALQERLTAAKQTTDALEKQLAASNDRIASLDAALKSRTSPTTAQPVQASQPQPSSAPNDQGSTAPIRWEQLGFGFQGGPEPMFMDIEILSEITGMLPVEIKNAYIISGTTGEKLPMMLDAGKEGKILPRNANPIPNGMRFYLTATFSSPLSGLQLLSKWGKVLFFAEYDDKKYERTFDEEYMRNQLSRYPGSGLGPRITKKEDAKGN